MLSGTERRPIVEFAIENAQTLKKRDMRRPRMAHAEAPEADTEDGGNAAPEAASPAGPSSDAANAAAPAAEGKRKHRKNKRREKANSQVCSDTLSIFPAVQGVQQDKKNNSM